MGLFDVPSQCRETSTLWRMFFLLPLFMGLADGRLVRWFAINIPMDLRTGGPFTSDIDILAKLSDFPKSKNWIYRSWEVKVGLIGRDGSTKSLKSGKTARTLTQLKAYRKFGLPSVSLFDVFILEDGFLRANMVPPESVLKVMDVKINELREGRFGYRTLFFEHKNRDGIDCGLKVPPWSIGGSVFGDPTVRLLSVPDEAPRDPFLKLASRLDEFFESQPSTPKKMSKRIIFCRACKKLALIDTADEFVCPECGDLLITQT